MRIFGAHQAMMVGSSLYMRPLIVLTLPIIFCTESLYSCIGPGCEKKSSCACRIRQCQRARLSHGSDAYCSE